MGNDVSIAGKGSVKGLGGYASLPPGAKRGMVVIHEIWGRAPEIDQVVDRFAARGWAAVCPHLFSSGFHPLCIRKAMKELAAGRGEYLDQVNLAGEWLCEQAGLAKENVGVIGFCMGGGFALAVGSGWGVVSSNYGILPPLPEHLPPTIACYGKRDRSLPGVPAKLGKHLSDRKIPNEIHEFDGAGHAFLTPGTQKLANFLTTPILHVHYDPAIAEPAWGKIEAFLDRHLPEKRAAEASPG